jgi:hypothetical protein
MNRPQIKIRPVDSGSDRQTAEVIQGLIKNIEVQSDANIAYDTAFDGAVSCGFGAFRISSEYVEDTSFDQELRILPIMNQFSVYYDPDAQKWNKEDGEFWIITELMSRKGFEKKFPDADLNTFDADRDDSWGSHDEIRVAEYFYKDWYTGTLRLYKNVVTEEERKTIDETLDELEGWEEIRKRDVETFRIMWARVTGSQILEGPEERPGKHFPIIPIFGKNINIENKINYRGAVRNSKDSQRLYNYNRSASAELLSLAPKAPYLLTPTQVQNHEAEWKLSNKRNFTYLLYNPDGRAKGIPQRQPPNPVSTGIQQEVLVSDQELHDTTGLQRSALGKQGNEKSGKAIMARQKEGDVGNYQFTDNLIRAMTHLGRILVDLIPIYYDTPRVVRIFQEDGKDIPVMVNQPNESGQIYDLTTGRYDVTVNVGPSFTTQRQEAASSMIEFLQYVPDAAPMIADLVAKNMDWPGAEQIEKRLKTMLPPQVLAAEESQPGQQQPGQQQQEQQQDPLQQMQMEAQAKKMAAEETIAEMEVQLKQIELSKKEAELDQIDLENIEIATGITVQKFEMAQKIIGEVDANQQREAQQTP